MPAITLDLIDTTINGDTVREWSSVIGIVTAIVGNILISFALNIQRYAHIRLSREKDHQDKEVVRNGYGTQQEEIAEERSKANLAPSTDTPRHSFSSESSSQSTVKPLERETSDTRTYLSSPYWWAGIILMTIGECGNFLAYGFAPASIVSPLGVVALVSNCIIAPWLLKEKFRVRDLGGVLVAIAGAVVVVLSAKTSETRMGPKDIWSAITRWEFELYLGITAVCILVLIWASGRYGERSILIDLGLVGLFGGYTALSTKGVASLLSGTLWRTLTFPITYLLIVILVASAVMQIRYINRALQRFDSTQVIPTQFVLFTISVIIGSAVLYRDFESATTARVGKFIGGCLLTFIGVYLITSGRSQNTEDQPTDEEAIILVDEEISDVEHDSQRRKSSLSITFSNDSQSSCSSSHTPQRNPSSSSQPHTPLTVNPWSDARDEYHTRPTQHLEPTISTPLLPSDAQRSREGGFHHLLPSKHPDSRPTTLSRNSIANLRPAPFMSPLSSSLSAIVADSLRRGVYDSPSSTRRERPRLDVLRKTKSQRSPEEGVDDGRKQSVGGSLGEFLRLKGRSEGGGGGSGSNER
ncbi:MAG: hypothetical protein L6R41_003867 [Letrouitia leprolyta]|nr:MAG: hypothetical protein L6R41_003867 [Letrouitia leprolyta]